MRKIAKVLVSAVLATSVFTLLSAKVYAQEDPSQKIIPSLELDQADVREAIKILFRNVGVSYSIAPDVQGVVTVSLRNVPFETALQNILKQVNATYRVEGGVYQIIARIEETTGPGNELPTTTPSAKPPIRKLKIRSADPLFIMMMLQGTQSTTSVWPEMSTVFKTGSLGGGGGFGGNQGGLGGGGFGGGLGGGLGGGGFGGGMGGFGGGMGGFGGGGFGGGMGGGPGMGR